MKPYFDTVTIIGVGLLGGSLGLALKARGMAGVIRGVGHRMPTLETARAIGAVDECHLDAAAAGAGAQLIVVCTPAAMVPAVLDRIRPVCGDALVTDVASTKAVICEHAARTWPRPLRFVGSHPMAGSEKFGPEHSDPDLYEGAVTLIDNNPDAEKARAEITALWESLGSRVAPVAPDAHDALVARTSHIPHIVAGCVARLADAAGDVQPFCASGFRDVTRVAAGRPELWRDICLTNRAAIADGLAQLEADLATVREMVDKESGEELFEFFRSAQEARNRALGEA